MHDKLMKMLEKKKGSELSGVEKDAKMGVLSGMKKMAEDAMSGKLKGLKKVTVASDSPAGLEEGLEKARELVGKKDESMDEEDEDESSEESSEEYSAAEQEIQMCSDIEELNKLEEMIQSKKMELMKK